MNLYKEILIEVLSKQKVKITIENFKHDSPNEIVEMTCCKTIERIRRVLDNSDLN